MSCAQALVPIVLDGLVPIAVPTSGAACGPMMAVAREN